CAHVRSGEGESYALPRTTAGRDLVHTVTSAPGSPAPATRARARVMATVILDLARLEANLHRLARAATARSVAVRAHVKAHRTVEITLRQIAAGAAGVAVQTAHAARRLAAAGVDDV